MNQDSPHNSDKELKLVGRCRAQIYQSLGSDLPKLAFIFGSGFQDLIHGFRVLSQVSYSALPGFPKPSVPGHAGVLLRAELQGLPCLVCNGRVHYYEGHSMNAVMFPVQMLAACGVRELVLTNAAGGINPGYKPGEFMLLTDHINLIGVNPLRSASGAPAFVDLSRAYSPALAEEFLMSASRARVRLHTGVYMGVSGPSYETPAEIRAFRMLGADAVGMSTIPEVLMARKHGMEVAAISCITNPAAGLRRRALSHKEVLDKGRESAESALRLVSEFAHRRVRKAARAPGSSRNNLNNSPRPLGSAPRKR